MPNLATCGGFFYQKSGVKQLSMKNLRDVFNENVDLT
jgi:hypothetical protein